MFILLFLASCLALLPLTLVLSMHCLLLLPLVVLLRLLLQMLPLLLLPSPPLLLRLLTLLFWVLLLLHNLLTQLLLLLLALFYHHGLNILAPHMVMCSVGGSTLCCWFLRCVWPLACHGVDGGVHGTQLVGWRLHVLLL